MWVPDYWNYGGPPDSARRTAASRRYRLCTCKAQLTTRNNYGAEKRRYCIVCTVRAVRMSCWTQQCHPANTNTSTIVADYQSIAPLRKQDGGWSLSLSALYSPYPAFSVHSVRQESASAHALWWTLRWHDVSACACARTTADRTTTSSPVAVRVMTSGVAHGRLYLHTTRLSERKPLLSTLRATENRLIPHNNRSFAMLDKFRVL